MEISSFKKVGFILTSLLVVGHLTSCGASGDAGGADGRNLPPASSIAGSSDMLQVAVNYVSFQDDSGNPIVSESAAREVVEDMSAVWRQCNITYVLEKYEAISPSAIGARMSPANYSELNRMRENIQNPAYMLMMATGTWNRSGDLGNSGSNCYSSFPGDTAEGVVCERKSAAGTMMLAHESGHFFNLRHTNSGMANNDGVEDTTTGNVNGNLMDHVVSYSNDELTNGQCVRARENIANWRYATLR